MARAGYRCDGTDLGGWGDIKKIIGKLDTTMMLKELDEKSCEMEGRTKTVQWRHKVRGRYKREILIRVGP